MSVLIRNARVLLAMPAHPGCALRGGAMGGWPVIERGDVLIEGDRIARVGAADGGWGAAREIDAGGRVLMPGLVDCHTHACWAGDRFDEWELKRSGVTYLEILKRGGGIMSTVRAVRKATLGELAASLGERLSRMLRLGSTTIEVKSGYGLSTADELKMLRAIGDAAAGFGGTVVPTALIGHAIDADAPSAAEFVERTIRETLPAIHAEFPGIAIDAYCEQGAWSLADCRRLFERAMELGHPVRVHADQFNNLGIIGLNAEWCGRAGDSGGDIRGDLGGGGFRTVDHLEASDAASLAALARSPSIGTLLPCTGFHTDGRYANGRGLIDAGGAVALASNANPGSSPCLSMQMAIALSVRFNGLGVREALAAATVNAGIAAGLGDRGVISPGARADVILLDVRDERALAYEFGGNAVGRVFCGGVEP